jgi:hypothetical protein
MEAEELAQVEQELREVEEDLNVLLLHQSELLDRRKELQQQLEGEQLGDDETDRQDGGKPAQDWKAQFLWTEQIHTLLRDTVSIQNYTSTSVLDYRLTRCCSSTCQPSARCRRR